MHIIQTPKIWYCLRKDEGMSQELKRWTVKVLNVQIAGEFVLLIAKKATQ